MRFHWQNLNDRRRHGGSVNWRPSTPADNA